LTKVDKLALKKPNLNPRQIQEVEVTEQVGRGYMAVVEGLGWRFLEDQ
jgi:hypothetical protein